MKRALLFAIIVACCATNASAQLKLGYINSEVFKERLPEFKDAQRMLEQLSQESEKKIKDREAELLKMQEDFRRQELLMSEARKAELQAEFEAKVQQFQQFVQDKSGELRQKEVELLEPIFKKINDAIQSMAKEEGYDFIFDAASGLLVFPKEGMENEEKENYDLTDEVLSRLVGLRQEEEEKQ